MIVGHLVGKLFGIQKSDGGFQSIKMLLDSTKECLSSLKNLGVNTQTWDPLLIHLTAQKLDIQTRRDWEHSLRSSTEIPSRSEMFDFLERTFRTLESIQDSFPSVVKQEPSKPKQFTSGRKTSVHSGKFVKQDLIKCPYCEKSHVLSKCYKFLALTFASRNKFVLDKGICRNCLTSGHVISNCGSPFRCIICKEQHHTVLHPDGHNNSRVEINNAPSTSSGCGQGVTQMASHNVSYFQYVLLYTIRLKVKTNHGMFALRALLDPGSQGSLITESAVQLLGLRRIRSHCQVIGIGNGHSNLSKYAVGLDLISMADMPVISCVALVLPKLSSYSPTPSSRYISLPDNVADSLADPYFYKSDKIDMILGSDVCSKIKIPAESFVHDGFFFQNTYFGWVFSGSTEPLSANRVHIHTVNLESILKSFWEQEDISSDRDLTWEESACEAHFTATSSMSESGRYMVQLPFRNLLRNGVLPDVDNNVTSAFKRLRQLEISFSKRPQFAEAYKSFMREYESLGHMSKVGTYPQDTRRVSYFLPHHGVFKEDSTTTKLRVVFDGSGHMGESKSLNELLSPGPALQNDLPSVMTQWRRHRISFSADIEKMFRQIDVCPEHRKFQQILWRYDPFQEISIYELNTVTYGTASAPYLAIRVLQKLSNDYCSEFPGACKVLLTDTYVDDVLSGAKGGCRLRKWVTNSNDLLSRIPVDYRDPSMTIDFDRGSTVKTLGVRWNTWDDSFSFKIELPHASSVTKRSILSESASIYDPLGWLTPSTVVAKSLFKTLWENGLNWDDDIPDEIRTKWLRFRNSFCDASTAAYAAVIYCRSESVDGVVVNILQAKSKVTPIKTVTIPRLELCAAALSVKLAERVKRSLRDIEIDTICYWSDSSTVLSWIRKSPSTWSVYVANRVAEIQRLSNPLDWRYIPSAQNPADCASRGIGPNDLLESKIWWNGPEFLLKPESFWPQNLPNLYTCDEARKSKVMSYNSSSLSYPELLLKYSKLQTLLRVTALCFRFLYNCRNASKKRTCPLTLSETNESLLRYVKLTQGVDFRTELFALSTNAPLKNTSILKLMPFLDKENIIRVGGRLGNSSLSYDLKHPMLLSKANPLSSLIISDAHGRTLHGGVTLTMSYVNRKFWIISGNTLAKTIIRNCIPCFKYTAKTSQQIMGNLPNVRLTVTRPFSHSGVDYAGPISIKTSSLRTASTTKGYICLFICMVTKAIHLEAVSDLTTNAFLAAFRRFISRRGLCTDLYSDCGTNFVGASKELKVIYNRNKNSISADLHQALGLIGTTWHFIPPASPNFGGLWEAGVKSTKYHLKRIVKDRILNYEELSTLLCQIESCLNSRPLAPLSSDHTNFDALTPAHFLVGEPTTCIQEESLLDTNINLLTRWKCVEKMKQHFWKRWRNEFLNRLQARPKWLCPKPEASVGDLVLISDERCGPGQWLLGRIQETHPGPDGHARVVSVLTKNKIIKRPITKICFLPGAEHETLKSPLTSSSKI
ncbi:uncharacterized protein LOC142235533 [Haematobia irritans]|uniref:uncharacterized protein LOC142235533 n=2 Tax=Haematobia irritans TaxID=7368 RepID=UPI003F4FC6CA